MPAEKCIRQPELTTESFWQYSLTVYPQTKASCLHWQNSYGANVNLLLLLYYIEALGYTLQIEQLHQLHQTITAFSQHITKPLRAIRQRLPAIELDNSQQEILKQSILTTELVAERVEQQLLLQQLPILQQQQTLTLPEHYLKLLNTEQTDELRTQILDLRQASQCYIAAQP